MTRIVYLGSFGNDWDTESYVLRALERAECGVTPLEEEQTRAISLAKCLNDDQPNLFLFAKGRIGGQWDPTCALLGEVIGSCIGSIGTVACWVFDLLTPEFNPERRRWAENVSRIADVVFLTDGQTASELPNARVLRQGVPDDVRPGVPQPQWQADVLFLGGAYRERAGWLERLRRGLAVHGRTLLHVPEGVRGASLADLMASVKLVVAPEYPAAGAYWSNRLYVAIGYGGCLLAPEVSGINNPVTGHVLAKGMRQEGWIPNEHYYSYSGEADLLEKCLWLLDPSMDAQRHEVAKWGQKYALAKHTYDHRVRDLLKCIGVRVPKTSRSSSRTAPGSTRHP